MITRILVGLMLGGVIVGSLFLPPWGTAALFWCWGVLAVWEERKALLTAGHRPVTWPTFAVMVLSVPAYLLVGLRSIPSVIVFAVVIMCATVMFRKEPKLTDLNMSILPLWSVAIPGLMLILICAIPNENVRRVYLFLVFAVSVLGDTFALFFGKAFGKRKPCPGVSPKKTIAGFMGGFAGAVASAMLIAAISYHICNEAEIALLPNWWEFAMLGVVGSVMSQLGDLLASLVKRHCGIKDFSGVFPGHGGLLDRADSVIMMAVVIFCFLLIKI